METENAAPVTSESAFAKAASSNCGDTDLRGLGENIFNILSVMAEVFDKAISNRLISAYYAALKDEPQDALRQAALVWLRTGNRFPYPSDLIRK